MEKAFQIKVTGEIFREDLKELGISQSLEFMESKPTDGF